jgi:uncharacterized protein YjbI with pentapeptide repeats
VLAIVLMGFALADASDDAMPYQGTIQYRVISAKDIQDNAAGSPIHYDHAVIIGDLDLNQADCKSIEITNSIIRGNASFVETTFSDRAIFRNTTFCRKAEFGGSRFDSDADFNSSHFDEAANFSESIFLEAATFDYSTFRKTADFAADSFAKSGSFYNCTFAEDAFFYLSQFNGVYANFESTRFLKNIDFDSCQCSAFLSFAEAKIKGNADFHGCKFAGGVIFLNSTFLGYSNFARCHFSEDSRFQRMLFNDTADFSDAKFDGPSFFNRTSFGGKAQFDGAQFLGPSDFTDVQFDGELALNSTKISTMVLDGSTFHAGSRLYLAKADINRLMVKWSEIKDILSYDTSAYLSLVKNYRDMGTNDADDCYYQFRSVTQDMRDWGGAKILDMLADITCGYGVRADRPVLCSIALILICSTILWAGNGLRRPTDREKKTGLLDALYYCLAIFFTIPLPDLMPMGLFRYVPVVLRAIAWTLFALLIATLGKVMIK